MKERNQRKGGNGLDRINETFLKILKAALLGEQFSEFTELSEEEWKSLLKLAEIHNVLPLVYQSAFKLAKTSDMPDLRSKIRRLVMMQTVKTAEFTKCYNALEKAGAEPVVVKGFVCRLLYPQPDLRLSGDEDILIPKEQFELCHRSLMEQEMFTNVAEENLREAYEVPYCKKNGALYIELHKSLFPPESDAYGDWNVFFEKALENKIEIGGVKTLCHTDHLFYLICHAFKHFLHSGFGIRQVCDIVMYANAYGNKVDWEKVYDNCLKINAQVFAAALFCIGKKYLVFDEEKACYPSFWKEIETDESDMLEDLLSAGVFGGATMNRRHSSNMTLGAVSDDKKGKKAKASLKSALFPAAKSLENRYPYLKKHPFLLPFAWLSRILTYLTKKNKAAGDSAAESVKIGSERVELLRKYKVIK